jgi:Beta-ketoacyl synthase, N-terminal domain
MSQPNMSHSVCIDGIAWWSPALPGWQHAATALRGDTSPETVPSINRPSPTLLAPNERRRAPDTVLLALEVAAAAAAQSGHDLATLASVFTSAHGDLPTTHALCTSLAADPSLLSPTRFHHSVHNAASGYWAIAAKSRAPSTALSAYTHSYAAGLLEAASQCVAENRPVLLVAYDTQACGALASVNRSQGLLAVALVLSPQPGPASQWVLRWGLQTTPSAAPPLHSAAAQALAHNAMADALPFFEALAAKRKTVLHLPLQALALGLQLEPITSPVLPAAA